MLLQELSRARAVQSTFSWTYHLDLHLITFSAESGITALTLERYQEGVLLKDSLN